MRSVPAADRRIRGTAAAVAVVAVIVICFIPMLFVPWPRVFNWLKECPMTPAAAAQCQSTPQATPYPKDAEGG